tara:strand:+ start:615 stop:1076 length:462 start_codon:yes stop_codon:yes gene_type:complete
MWQDFWNLRINDRLTKWKDFRHQLDRLPLDSAVVELNNMWSTAPFVTHNLSPDDPTNWPNPWELLAENYWCGVAKALGILYTIYFTSHKSVNLELRIYYDYKEKERHAVAWIDNGKYILNYWPYEIVNTKHIEEKQLKMLHRYTSEDLKLDNF